jgi:hypothetical protein
MRFSKSSTILVFGLLLGGIFSPRAEANADEHLVDDSIFGIDRPVQRMPAAALTAISAQPPSDEDLPDGDLPDDPGQQALAPSGATSAQKPDEDPLAQGRQTKRILFVVPNFRAVSADQQLPPQTVKEKFKTAMLDSFDYSSFIFVGAQAGIGQATNSYPYFGQGTKGYGRYYWHTLVDAINENTWVEFIIPAALHQDTRYYTLGKGEFGKRVGYAITRVFITRSDDGNKTINYSEIVGAGAFAGIANFYYPHQERTLTKTYQRWVTNLAIDGGVFVFKEIWPDINNSVFHQKD